MHPDLQRHIGKYYGKYSGVVADYDAELEEDDIKLGWIRVQVPSVFGPDYIGTARPCFPYGHFAVPKAGAHVWIEFEAGDARHPLYTGFWYPTGTVPPEADANPPLNRVVQMPSGHTVEFEDKEGEEKIVIRHKDNAFIALDKDGSVLVSNKNGSHVYLNAKDGDATFTEQHGNIMHMKSDGIVVVNAAGTLFEMKEGKVKVVSQDAVTLMAKDVNIESATVNLGQNAGTAGERVLLGETFLMAFATHVHPTALGPSGPPLPVPPFIPPPVPNVPHLLLSSGVKVKKP